MKKFLIIFAIAGILTACNNSSEGSTSEDTLNKTGDSTNMNTTNDSLNLAGDSSRMNSDTSRIPGDTSIKK